MKSLTQSRVVIACFALFSMLFMQLAVASYSCPLMMGNSNSANSMLTSANQILMPDCNGMDMEQPTLCHAHASGEPAKQSLDKSELPQVQLFVPAELVLALHVIDVAYSPSITPRGSMFLIRTTSPPLAIRHCCFRL